MIIILDEAEIEAAIGHAADYECDICGGPEWSATSQRGCDHCQAQDDIVARGTVARRKLWQLRALEYCCEHFPASHAPLPTLIREATAEAPLYLLYVDFITRTGILATFKGEVVELETHNQSVNFWPEGSQMPLRAWQTLSHERDFIPFDPFVIKR